MSMIWRCKHGILTAGEKPCLVCNKPKLYPKNGMTLGNMHPLRKMVHTEKGFITVQGNKMTFRSENRQHLGNDELLERISHVEREIERRKIILADIETNPLVTDEEYKQEVRDSVVNVENDIVLLYAELENRM